MFLIYLIFGCCFFVMKLLFIYKTSHFLLTRAVLLLEAFYFFCSIFVSLQLCRCKKIDLKTRANLSSGRQNLLFLIKYLHGLPLRNLFSTLFVQFMRCNSSSILLSRT